MSLPNNPLMRILFFIGWSISKSTQEEMVRYILNRCICDREESAREKELYCWWIEISSYFCTLESAKPLFTWFKLLTFNSQRGNISIPSRAHPLWTTRRTIVFCCVKEVHALIRPLWSSHVANFFFFLIHQRNV